MTGSLLALWRSPRIRIDAALIVWCALMVVARVWRAGAPAYFFLCWNLFLAGIPAGASVLFEHESRRGGSRAMAALWFAVWLVFLPNAPYVFAAGFTPAFSTALAPALVGELLVDLDHSGLLFGTLDGAG